MKRKGKIFIFFLLLSGVALILVWGVNHPQNYSFLSSSSTLRPKSPNPKRNLVNNSSVNLLFLGIAGNGSRGALLTDTIFVTHLDPEKKKITLISIPRDLWVTENIYPEGIKINGLFELENRGKQFSPYCSFHLIQKEVEKILGIKIDYVIIFDLEGVEKLVDSIGGINIYLPQDIADPYLVNPHHPSEIFHLKAGWNYLDGALVAKFVRTRYAPSGDFYRIQHQHQIIAALRDKVEQLTSVWHFPTWFKLWQSLKGHYLTNLNFNLAWQIFQSIKNIPADKIQYLVLSNRPPDNLLISGRRLFQGKKVYVLLPRAGENNYLPIHNYIQEKING